LGRTTSATASSRKSWDSRLRSVIETKRGKEEIYDSPNREHHEEANNRPHNKLAAFGSLLGIPSTLDEVTIDSKKENNKRNCKKYRDYQVYDTENEGEKRLKVRGRRKGCLGESEKRNCG
jgi:hypothetical protein